MPINESFGNSSSNGFGFGLGTVAAGGGGGGSTDITLIGSQLSQNSATGASLTLTQPSSTAIGDLLIAILGNNSAQSGNWTFSGWTQAGSSNGTPNAAVYYRTAAAAGATTHAASFSRSTSTQAGVILTYRNAVYADIGLFDTNTGGASQSRIAPGTNVNFYNTVDLAAFVSETVSETFTTPSGWTSIFSDNDVNAPSFGIFSQSFGVTDTTSDATVNLSASTSDKTAGVQIFMARSSAAILSLYSETSLNGLSQTTTSSTITVSSGTGTLTLPANVTVSKNGGAYTSTPPTFVANDTFAFRATSSASYNVNTLYTIQFGTDTPFRWTVSTANSQLYTTAGTFTFVVPSTITSISMLTLGSGGGTPTNNVTQGIGTGGGGGGALSYTNSIAVTPGESLTVVVGAGPVASNGNTSSISRGATTLVSAFGGSGKTTISTTGAAGGTTGGVGTVKFAGGAGASGASTTTNNTGASGGGGGGAARPNATGTTGVFVSGIGGFATNGEPGDGVTFITTGWSDNLSSPLNSATNVAQNGFPQGGGAGGTDGSFNGTAGVGQGGTGGAGVAVLIWGGRTFSSATTY